MKIKKVLVTGGAGCIGYQVCKLLEEKRNWHDSCDCEVTCLFSE